MAEKIVDVKLKTASDTQANWKSKNTTLLDGELAYDKTKKNLKIGDGITAWNNLPYLIPEVEIAIELFSAQVNSNNATMPVTPTPTNEAYFSDKDGNMITSNFSFPGQDSNGEWLYVYIATKGLEINANEVQIGLILGEEPLYFRKTSETTGYLSDEVGSTNMTFTLVKSENVSNYYTKNETYSKSEVDDLIVETPIIEIPSIAQELLTNGSKNGTFTEEQVAQIIKAKGFIVSDTTAGQSYYFKIQLSASGGVYVLSCESNTDVNSNDLILCVINGTNWMAQIQLGKRFTEAIYNELKASSGSSSGVNVIEIAADSTQTNGTLTTEQYNIFTSNEKENVAFKVYNDDYMYTFFLTYSHATDDNGFVYTCTTQDEVHSLTLYAGSDEYFYEINTINNELVEVGSSGETSKVVIRMSCVENDDGSLDSIMSAEEISVFQNNPENVEFLIEDSDWGYTFHLTYAFRMDDGTFRYMVSDTDGTCIYLDIMDGFYSYHYFTPNSSGGSSGGLKVVDFPVRINYGSNYESGELDNTQELMEADVIVVNESFLLHKSYDGGNYCTFSLAEKIVAENYTEYITLMITESGYEYSYINAPIPAIKDFPDSLSIYTSSSNNLHDGEAEEISLYNEIMVYAELNIYLKKVDYDEADTGNVGYSTRIYYNGQWYSCYLYLDLANNSYIWTVKNDNSGGGSSGSTLNIYTEANGDKYSASYDESGNLYITLLESNSYYSLDLGAIANDTTTFVRIIMNVTNIKAYIYSTKGITECYDLAFQNSNGKHIFYDLSNGIELNVIENHINNSGNEIDICTEAGDDISYIACKVEIDEIGVCKINATLSDDSM